MRNNILVTVLLFCLFAYVESVSAEELQEKETRLQKTQEFCTNNPDHARCEKFLDGKYRRFKDADEEKLDVLEKKVKVDSKLEDKRSRKELLSFCRTEPTAERCKNIK